MFKGKFGVSLPAVAVLAFVLAFLGFWELTLLLVGFAVLLEKDEWLGRQTMSALILALLVYSVKFGVRAFFKTWKFCVEKIKEDSELYFYNPKVESTIIWIVGIIFFALVVIAIIQVMKHKDSKLPLVYNLTNWAFGVVAVKQVYQQQPMQYQQPVQQQMQQPNLYQPIPQPVTQQSGATCPKCGAPVNGKFCGVCGANI